MIQFLRPTKPANSTHLLPGVLLWLVTMPILIACSEPSEKSHGPALPPQKKGELFLASDSPKKAYIKTVKLNLTQPPVMEPLAGKITYNESMTSRISSPVAGRVVGVPIALGTRVKVGSTLLELDSPDVAAAEADFAKAQADLTLASHAFERQQELYAGKAASRKELEQAQDDLLSARSDVKRAEERLKNLNITARKSDGRFALRSTIQGVVVERNVNPGMEVRPDREAPLFVVSELSELTVLMEVFEVNLGKIKVGQKLSVTVPAYPGEVFPATVAYVGQVLDENTRTVQVRCDLPNRDGRLLPGMYASVTVQSDPGERAIVVPLTAVFTKDNADYVFVALDDNHFQQRAVEIGLRLKDKAVVVQGLKPDEQLVTEGALMLRAEEEVQTDNTNP